MGIREFHGVSWSSSVDRKTATISRALRRGVTLDIDRLRSFWQVERPNLNGESFFFWQLSVLRNACLYFILTSLCLVLSFNLLFLTSGLLRLHHHVCLPCPTCQGFPRGAFGGDYLDPFFPHRLPLRTKENPTPFGHDVIWSLRVNIHSSLVLVSQ